MGLALITQWIWRATVPSGWPDDLACILRSYRCSYVKMSEGLEFKGAGFQSYLMCLEVGLQESHQSSLSLNSLINKMKLMMMVR